jgi:2-polyprenyl-3-methyl-5-hydroxy-6-metoxy-1,4-benzoquinol methylase
VIRAERDQAGPEYWNRAWDEAALPELWPVDSRDLRAHVERSLFLCIAEALATLGVVDDRKSLIEAGCARSGVLPLFAKKLGLRIAGIDYSPNGCEQARLILARENVMGEIYCHDVFSLPGHLVERFDILVSFGLIEHFSDTTAIVAALSRLVRPGGVLFTNLPNMNGTTGLLQRVLDRGVYDIHVPLTADAVRKAHEEAGLEVLACDYFLSTNYGVVNLNSIRARGVTWWTKRILLAGFARLSMATWWCERLIGPVPTSRAFSPYINCLARKPGGAPFCDRQ